MGNREPQAEELPELPPMPPVPGESSGGNADLGAILARLASLLERAEGSAPAAMSGATPVVEPGQSPERVLRDYSMLEVERRPAAQATVDVDPISKLPLGDLSVEARNRPLPQTEVDKPVAKATEGTQERPTPPPQASPPPQAEVSPAKPANGPQAPPPPQEGSTPPVRRDEPVGVKEPTPAQEPYGGSGIRFDQLPDRQRSAGLELPDDFFVSPERPEPPALDDGMDIGSVIGMMTEVVALLREIRDAVVNGGGGVLG